MIKNILRILFTAVLMQNIASAQIRLVSIDPITDVVEIKNFGGTSVDITSYWFCTKFAYSQLSSLTVQSGSLNLAAGASVVVSGQALNNTAADLGLYLSSSFGSTSAMVDFVQWGSSPNGRESVAVSKGIWSAGDFITGNAPYLYIGDGTQNGLPFWTETAELSSEIIVSATSCQGLCDGMLTADASGGTSPYSYLWDNGATTISTSGLCVNTYQLTVTDNVGASITVSGIVSEPSNISVSFSETGSTCSTSDGSLSVAASGGNSGYSYLWSAAAGNQTTITATGLSSGTYSVTVLDQNNCNVTATGIVTDSGSGLSITFSTTPTACGSSNGEIVVNVAGGVSSYNYLWSNNETTASISGLTSGNYSITVSDQNSCEESSSTLIINIGGPSVNSTSVSDVSCYGLCDGEIMLSVSGGTTPYSYQWNNGATIAEISELCVNQYSVVVTDNNDCITNSSVSITGPTEMFTTVTTTDQSCVGECDGSVGISTSGSGSAYGYLWNNGATNASITGLCSGSYSITITDDLDCSRIEVISVTAPDTIKVTIGICDVLCAGELSGVVGISGSSSYSYLWSDGSTTEMIMDLSADTLSVTISEGICFEVIDSIIVKEPTSLIVQIEGFMGNTFVSPSVTVSGGISPYTYLWSNGATTQVYDTNIPCNFETITVTVFDAQSCNISTQETIVCESIEELNEEELQVFPNPNNGLIYFNLKSHNKIEMLNVYDKLGKLAYSNANISNNVLDLKTLPKGIYIIEIKTEKGILNRKIQITY